MSITKAVQDFIQQIPVGEPFTNQPLLKLGSRAAVDKALSRLNRNGVIQRLARGIYMRPKHNRWIGPAMPELHRILEVIARDYNEVMQMHGAEAARRFKLTTQQPTLPVYYTSGASREIHIGKLRIKLLHTTNRRKLQHAGKKPGMALSALWYLGKEKVDETVIQRIHEALSEEEFEILRASSMPAWMARAIEQHGRKATHD